MADACLTPSMDETDESVDIDVLVETEIIDVDGDGVVDIVTETTTTVIDVDGDGVADIVQTTTTTAYDVDGDGEPDIIESTTITGVDVDGDGEFSEDEIEIDETIAVTEELAAELEELEAGD
jgi:hypothetical protein